MAKACVIFDSRYGNTEKIARSLESGLERAGVATACTTVGDAVVEALKEYDLICVGGPTHYQTASEAMQSFLRSLPRGELKGKRAFAFDTRRDSLLAGSAAKFVEGELRRKGMKILAPRESAIMVRSEPEKSRHEFDTKEGWKEWRHLSEGLTVGEEARFMEVGVRLGANLLRTAEGARSG